MNAQRVNLCHPQFKGKLERLHRVWNNIVSKRRQDPLSWDEMIPSAMLLYAQYYIMQESLMTSHAVHGYMIQGKGSQDRHYLTHGSCSK